MRREGIEVVSDFCFRQAMYFEAVLLSLLLPLGVATAISVYWALAIVVVASGSAGGDWGEKMRFHLASGPLEASGLSSSGCRG
nr:hypothetical protein [Tanacetum cinerariifolium]